MGGKPGLETDKKTEQKTPKRRGVGQRQELQGQAVKREFVKRETQPGGAYRLRPSATPFCLPASWKRKDKWRPRTT